MGHRILSSNGSSPGLLGRRDECETLSRLVAGARVGRSAVLVLRGEAGAGKSALLDVLVRSAAGFRIGRAVGVEVEKELAFAGLHQLCGPYLHRLHALPAPHRDALCTAFRLRPGPSPDPSLVGSAVLTMLGRLAEERPLICVVDDAQWLDEASAQTLEFVARRLGSGPMALVFAVREPAVDLTLAGFPELVVGGLSPSDAATLLASAVRGTLDPRVRNRILAESHGNPLALLELPRGMSPTELAFGGATSAGVNHQVHHLEQGFLREAAPLPRQSRRLLLAAAAEPVGDVPLLLRTAARLGIGAEAATAAEAAGLLELHEGVRFRHPLARSAVYRQAGPAERREVHRALADVTDPDIDPDRRAWHRARAAVSLDESVAADLERSADQALSHGGVTASAAFLEQAAALTPDPARRVQRSLGAAQAKVHAGALDEASALLATAQTGTIGDAERARIDRLRAAIALARRRGHEAVPLLLAAAHRLEPLDPRLARDTYVDALSAALLAAGPTTVPGARQVAEAVRKAPRPQEPRRGDALLDALAVLLTEGYAPATPLARAALRTLAVDGLTMDEALRFGLLAAAMAASWWDDVAWDALSRRFLDVVRASGALGALPLALHTRVVVQLFTGDLAAAESLVVAARSLADVIPGDSRPAAFGEVGLLAIQGRAQEAEPLIRDCLDESVARCAALGATTAQWARAILCNALGRYGTALDAARKASEYSLGLGPATWALAELVEAGARSGRTEAASGALDRLSAMARASGTDWALGIEASRRALLKAGTAAEKLHREAIERLGRTLVRVELARAQLLYGEWLRREGRRLDARVQLHTASESLTSMGLDAFADRARRELLATGATVRKRSVGAFGQLTGQEGHIARLAAEGLTNPEIAAALSISPRTVEWHLRQIFIKLGVTTRRQLRLFLTAPAEP